MPSELIHVGATSVRFLVEGTESNDSVAIFEVSIPARKLGDVMRRHGLTPAAKPAD